MGQSDEEAVALVEEVAEILGLTRQEYSWRLHTEGRAFVEELIQTGLEKIDQ